MNKIVLILLLVIGLLGCKPKTVEGTFKDWTLSDESVIGLFELENPSGREYFKISKPNNESVRVEKFNPNGIVVNTTVIVFQNGKLFSVTNANQWGYVYSTYEYTKQGSDQFLEIGKNYGTNTNLPCKGKILTFKNGLLINSKYVGFDGKDCECEEGYSMIKYERYGDKDRFGLVKAISYFGLKGERVASKDDDYHIKKTERDERGNVIEESYFGIEEMPVKTRIGFHKMMKKYDENDNNIEVEYFDLGKNKVENIYGTSKIIYEYAEGKIKKLIRFNAENKISLQTQSKVSDGAAIVKYDYDDRGNNILQSYFDADDKPFNTNKGYHLIERKYDNKNMLKEYQFKEKGNKPFKNTIGIHRYYYINDNYGRVILVAYFDDKEAPVKDEASKVFITKYTYDEDGRTASESYWENEDKKMTRWDKVHEERSIFNKEGQLTELIYLDENGNLLKSLSGESRIVYTYDKYSRKETMELYDSKIPINISNAEVNGYHKIQYFYDEQNRLEKIEYFNKDNEPVNVTINKYPSVQKITFEYQGRGIIRQKWFEAGSDIPKKVIDCIENQCMSTVGWSISFVNK